MVLRHHMHYLEISWYNITWFQRRSLNFGSLIQFPWLWQMSECLPKVLVLILVILFSNQKVFLGGNRKEVRPPDFVVLTKDTTFERLPILRRFLTAVLKESLLLYLFFLLAYNLSLKRKKERFPHCIEQKVLQIYPTIFFFDRS